MGKVSISTRFFKSLGIFGSVEVLNMACNVVRNKLVTLWIGAVGVGVLSLYTATIELIQSFALLNIRQSSVPLIVGETDPSEQARICRHVEVFGLVIGAAATVLTAALSPLLSWFTFGSYDYAWGFALLSPIMLFTSTTLARQAVLQAVGRLKVIAKASFFAVLTGTVVVVPLYWFFRMAAIVPSMIIMSALMLLFVLTLSGSSMPMSAYSAATFRLLAKKIFKLGSFLTVGISVGILADYIVRVYISRQAGVADVGVFQAGISIVRGYVGLFFTAVTMEFFPRLAATIDRRRYTSLIVSHEIVLALWLLAPVVVLFIGLAHWIVVFLYSSEFLAIIPYLIIAIIGTLFRAVSWCFSFVIVSRGDGKIYILTETVSALSLICLSVLGWHLWGFVGLGIAFAGQFVCYTAITWAVVKFRYGLRISKEVWLLLLFALVIAFGALALRIYVAWWAAPAMLLPVGLAMGLQLFKNKKKGR